ncbi:MAG: GNAT family N-acetyltransferase [Butyrivibrio sp.]|nr:GNAT family N-acetyltransferase [Butyrivibrio sp.]
MTLETDRLILRKWNDSDAGALYFLARNPEIGKKAGWLPHENVAYSRAIIRTVLNGDEDYAIVEKGGNDKPVGCISLMLEENPERTRSIGEGEIGYWVGMPYWNRGYATEAVCEILRHGFEDLKLQKIFCAYFDGNNSSKRVQEKCGFKVHHTNFESRIPMLHEVRTEHVNYITYDMWDSR